MTKFTKSRAPLKPMGMAMSHGVSHLYVSPGRGKKAPIVDPAAGAVQSSFEVGDRPCVIALSTDEMLLYTANRMSNDVSIVDAATQKVIKKVKVGDKPWGVRLVNSR